MMSQLATQLRHRQQTGLNSGQTPQRQGDRLVARQLRRLPCWFGRAAQPLDPAAPYDRAYTKHAPSHSDKDVPTTRAQQALEDRLISRGLAKRPHACWDLPEQFADDPGAPLPRQQLRALARLPLGYQGAYGDVQLGAVEYSVAPARLRATVQVHRVSATARPRRAGRSRRHRPPGDRRAGSRSLS